MRKIFTSLLFFCICFISFSQNSTFTGTIVEEETLSEISNAIVAIEGTALAQKTNADGTFNFTERIPSGEQIVTVTKDGYEVKLFLINVIEGKKVAVNQIEVSLTKDEKKRRRRIEKSLSKEEKRREKEREAKIKEAQKELEKREKLLAKQAKKLKKQNKDVIVSYDDNEEEDQVISEDIMDEISPLQTKYAEILGVTPEEITNFKLYEFIDEWMGTPYLMGGANKEGIDCSSFSQRLFTSVFGLYIERTAEKQFNSKYSDKFTDKSFLMEGDLLFFKGVGDYSNNISHVGIYLGNNKFVNSTSRRGTSGVSGVKISDLSEAFWTSRFVSAGRRINNN
tara:strand:- start:57001 stop:58014 length:1014 start_codon:yes stop_codon:yes gene_type:complete